MAYKDEREASYTAAERAAGTQTLGLYGGGTKTASGSAYDKYRAQGLNHAQAMRRLNKPKQTVAEVGDDFNMLAGKLGVDVQDLVAANPNDSTVKAGTALNVPQYADFRKADEFQSMQYAQRQKAIAEGRYGIPASEQDETPKWKQDLIDAGQFVGDLLTSGGGAPGAQPGETFLNREWWQDLFGTDGSGVGIGAGNFGLGGGRKTQNSPAYNPPNPPSSPYSGYNPPTTVVDPRSLTVEEGVYGDKNQTPVNKNIWDGHNYWEGHIDPYRLALNLAAEEGINLPPHPSENINAYMNSGDFASNYLRDIRNWEDSVYRGQRTPMVDIIKYDQVLYDKLMNDQLTTGDLLEIHRELPAFADQFFGGIENYPVEDQATYDILGKLGYIPSSGGGYGYSQPSYSYGGGGGYRSSSPSRQNDYPAMLSLTSWSI